MEHNDPKQYILALQNEQGWSDAALLDLILDMAPEVLDAVADRLDERAAEENAYEEDFDDEYVAPVINLDSRRAAR